MIWYVIFGVFAAFGVLCALWVSFGGLLTRVGTVAILCDGSEVALVRRYYWLRELGLTKCRLVLLDSQLPQQRQQRIREKCRDIEFCTLAQWRAGQDERREELD